MFFNNKIFQKTDERIPDNLEPGSIILFIDRKYRKKPDESGYNQVGVLLQNKKILCLRDRKIVILDYASISKNSVARCFSDNKQAEICCNYFTINKNNWRLINLGFISLAHNRFFVLTKPIIIPPLKEIPNIENRERLWFELMDKIEIGDGIMFRDNKSIISKVISYITEGPWSHAGIYIGNGKLIEATIFGVHESYLESYKQDSIRIGVYRPWKITDEKRKSLMESLTKHLGKKYNYIGVIRLGIACLLRIKLDKSKPKNNTPNDLIYRGLYLVAYY